MQGSTLSALVPPQTTGSVWPKSPQKIITPPGKVQRKLEYLALCIQQPPVQVCVPW